MRGESGCGYLHVVKVGGGKKEIGILFVFCRYELYIIGSPPCFHCKIEGLSIEGIVASINIERQRDDCPRPYLHITLIRMSLICGEGGGGRQKVPESIITYGEYG